MTDKRVRGSNHLQRALEITMREALDGMEQLAAVSGYGTAPGCYRIISIEKPPAPDYEYDGEIRDADILPFPSRARGA